jgi:hypothetical protein
MRRVVLFLESDTDGLLTAAALAAHQSRAAFSENAIVAACLKKLLGKKPEPVPAKPYVTRHNSDGVPMPPGGKKRKKKGPRLHKVEVVRYPVAEVLLRQLWGL